MPDIWSTDVTTQAGLTMTCYEKEVDCNDTLHGLSSASLVIAAVANISLGPHLIQNFTQNVTNLQENITNVYSSTFENSEGTSTEYFFEDWNSPVNFSLNNSEMIDYDFRDSYEINYDENFSDPLSTRVDFVNYSDLTTDSRSSSIFSTNLPVFNTTEYLDESLNVVESINDTFPPPFRIIPTLQEEEMENATRESIIIQVKAQYPVTKGTASKVCYKKICEPADNKPPPTDNKPPKTTPPVPIKVNETAKYLIRKKLNNLCWETMFGQEMVKLTMMDLVFTILSTLGVDFIRAIFVRVMNNCWCWDLEKQFPQYGDFKIAENILHLVNNQGMVWMGMFFSPGLTVLNLVKLAIIMYLRSWAVLTCNVPHEVVFRASRSNNFYFALLLTMLFLCVLPVGYAIVRIDPSWHCGPFSILAHENRRIYHIFTGSLQAVLPKSLHKALDYIASPGIVIPLLVLLVLIIYYMISLTNSLREANNDLKVR